MARLGVQDLHSAAPEAARTGVGQHDAALAHHGQQRDAPYGLPEFAQDPPGWYSQSGAPYGTADCLGWEFSESRS